MSSLKQTDFSSTEEEEEGEGDEDCFITFTTSESRCDTLFERGIDMVAQGDPNAALSAFLETLSTLQDCQYCNKLLPTLYQIAEAYRVLGETEKSREITDAVSIMQGALDEAMREKWKERKRQGRAGSVFSEQQQQLQQSDCGALFLKKAESILRESRERDDMERAVELAENVFRILQFTLGPDHPRTQESLGELIGLYTRGSPLHLAHCLEPIIFTATIKSLCSQFSEQNSNSEDSSTMTNFSLSLTLSGITLTHSTSSTSGTISDFASSLLHWSSDEDSLSTSSGEEASPHLHSYITQEEDRVSTPPLPPRAQLEGTQCTQDVVMDPEPWCGDKAQLECSVSHCSSGILSHHILPLSLRETANFASVFMVFVVFGLTVAVLSIDIF